MRNESLLRSLPSDPTPKPKYCHEEKHRYGEWVYLDYCNIKQRFCEDCPKCEATLINNRD